MGRPFKFEAVLNQRKYREESARKLFADAANAHRQARQVLSEMKARRERYRQAMRHKQENGGQAMEIILYSRYLGRIETEINAQYQTVGELKKQREHKRLELMTTLKDRKVIEKLKERHLADLEKEEMAMDQKISNDAAISRYQRKQ